LAWNLTQSLQHRKDTWCVGKSKLKTSFGILGTDRRMVLKLVLKFDYECMGWIWFRHVGPIARLTLTL
jgi:hypothetical protein